jgi:hypothetical protein
MKELEGRDPNDSIRITIFIDTGLGQKDSEEWVEAKLNTLKEYDPNFYYKTFSTRMGTMYTIDTKVRNTEHDDFSRFLFQARIKFAENLKIR